MYKVYILKCSDNTLYTGITTELTKRLRQHNGEIFGGAKYTLARKPVELLYFKKLKIEVLQSKREYEIKKLKRVEKLKLIELGKLKIN
ncbi:MAG: GIY-YIG nuclease family protein [Candidatus Gracilibacteria bacterium]|nr:GIY-YIG nuclease family protein [Candidatus Gracilibacteria bacterium]